MQGRSIHLSHKLIDRSLRKIKKYNINNELQLQIKGLKCLWNVSSSERKMAIDLTAHGIFCKIDQIFSRKAFLNKYKN